MDQRLCPVRPGVPHRRLFPLPQAAPGVILVSSFGQAHDRPPHFFILRVSARSHATASGVFSHGRIRSLAQMTASSSPPGE